jgi:phage terminase large subunit-like protein
MLKQREADLLRGREQVRSDLPHLYRPHYKWSREYYESDNKVNILCAANQVGKSSVAIRRVIANATEPYRWKKFWGSKKAPAMMWYFYPDQETKYREFETKWQEWLPRGVQASSGQYAWKVMSRIGANKLPGIQFASGSALYLLTYSQGAKALQASTVSDITADEELPVDLYDELIMRLTRTRGYFNAVFTPTLNQQFWREVFETNRRLPMAYKRQISMYDCLEYEDGIPSEFFTRDTIREIELKCKSQTEIDRRVHGKFVTEEGKKFYGFERNKHFTKLSSERLQEIKNWHKYSAVDPGTGGKGGHPAAIIFICLSPDCRKGYVFRAWRGDDVETSTQDILVKYEQLKGREHVILATYDGGSKDFGIIANRSGHMFIPANKARELGEDLINTLFRAGMLEIVDSGNEEDDDLIKLVIELEHAKLGEKLVGAFKKGDDLRDALRYGLMSMPWDLSGIVFKNEDEATLDIVPKRELTAKEKEEAAMAQQIEERRGMFEDSRQKSEVTWDIEYNAEIEEMNDFYG